MVMPNARRSAQQLKPFVKFRPRTLGGSGAVPGDVNENPFQAVPGIRVLSICKLRNRANSIFGQLERDFIVRLPSVPESVSAGLWWCDFMV